MVTALGCQAIRRRIPRESRALLGWPEWAGRIRRRGPRSAGIETGSLFCHTRLASNRPADRAAVAVRAAPSEASTERISSIPTGSEPLRVQESQMPKLKTKSGAKKRFKITGTGKVMYAQAGKRHGMIKRTTKQIRNLRGTTTLFEGDAANVKKYFLPNSR
jgi:large subunit ribosomal protein L35